jgi:hypothetical protein
MNSKSLRRERLLVLCTLGAALPFSAACPEVPKVKDLIGDASIPDASAWLEDKDAAAWLRDGGIGEPPYNGGEPPAGFGDGGTVELDDKKCLIRSRTLVVGGNDKLDLLFMVDNSGSMEGEQASLRAQFPRLITSLTAGIRSDGSSFAPIKDLHVGVVSSDMGVPGVMIGSCRPDGGDDGKLQNQPHGDACQPQYPAFLSFAPGVTDPQQLANDLGCIASLGTGGCGFEQQLEAPLKALMPKLLSDAAGNVLESPWRFLATDLDRTYGRGDRPIAEGGNAGFSRNDAAQGMSLLAVVVVTDEEDCSVKDTRALKPGSELPDDDPNKQVDINLRCFSNPQALYDLERYYSGFRALRPGREDLVLFATIAGIPPDLVSAEAAENTDFADPASRDAYYNAILGDPRMTYEVDPASNPGTGDGHLKPSCIRPPAPGETAASVAYPPRRIVQLAQSFGKNGAVASICQDDFGPAADTLIDLIEPHTREQCLPQAYQRHEDGMIGCQVIWELPAQVAQGSTAPTSCDGLPFLQPAKRPAAGGGKACVVSQLPVTDSSSGAAAPSGDGWYYDDYSDDTRQRCSQEQQQRIVFSPSAKPPTGVQVSLDCSLPFSLTMPRSDAATAVAQPVIGTPCDEGQVSGDPACVVVLNDNSQDTSMYCHPQLGVCVKGCTSNSDCPTDWTCATQGERPYCTRESCQ